MIVCFPILQFFAYIQIFNASIFWNDTNSQLRRDDAVKSHEYCIENYLFSLKTRLCGLHFQNVSEVMVRFRYDFNWWKSSD